VLIERATIVGNGGPGVEGGAAGLMEVRATRSCSGTASTSTKWAARSA